jgi:hypothetical protein
MNFLTLPLVEKTNNRVSQSTKNVIGTYYIVGVNFINEKSESILSPKWIEIISQLLPPS